MRVEITPTQYPIGIFYVPSSKTTNSFVLSFFFVLTTVERNSSEYPMVDLREKGMWPLSRHSCIAIYRKTISEAQWCFFPCVMRVHTTPCLSPVDLCHS